MSRALAGGGSELGRLAHPNNPILSAQVEAAQRRDGSDGFYRMEPVPSPDIPIPAATALERSPREPSSTGAGGSVDLEALGNIREPGGSSLSDSFG